MLETGSPSIGDLSLDVAEGLVGCRNSAVGSEAAVAEAYASMDTVHQEHVGCTRLVSPVLDKVVHVVADDHLRLP